MTDALIIFIKNAQAGKVKTRLASTVGDEQALKIYLELLRHTRDIALQVPSNRLLFYSNDISKNDDWSNADFQKALQQGSDLGARMSNAFKKAFETNSKVVIIGSDCASLNAEIVQDAFDQLDYYPFVIGPAIDGGYYLLGMNQFSPSLFEGIEWSTEKVFSSTVERIQKLGKRYFLLPQLSDIDYEEDWNKYGWEIK